MALQGSLVQMSSEDSTMDNCGDPARNMRNNKGEPDVSIDGRENNLDNTKAEFQAVDLPKIVAANEQPDIVVWNSVVPVDDGLHEIKDKSPFNMGNNNSSNFLLSAPTSAPHPIQQESQLAQLQWDDSVRDSIEGSFVGDPSAVPESNLAENGPILKKPKVEFALPNIENEDSSDQLRLYIVLGESSSPVSSDRFEPDSSKRKSRHDQLSSTGDRHVLLPKRIGFCC